MRDYFCGWYLKFQNGVQTVALIPAYHIANGEKTCSLQIITDDGSWNASFPCSAFSMDSDGVCIADSRFTRQGIQLRLHTPEITASGRLCFGEFDPIAYDIMGPFRYVPRMECRHSVFSMKHSVSGLLEINGRAYDFRNGVCYIEGDRGFSFPRHYVWTQCCFPEGSIMLSVADIPYCGIRFTGVISAIHFQGGEIRLATYLGARVVSLRDGEVVIRQGRKKLTVRRLEKKGHPLAAPVGGGMTRTIHETAACKTFFRYEEKGNVLFEFVSDQAAFEYEYPQ